MAKRDFNVPQETLPAMPERPFAPVNVGVRNSLSRALTPDYVGIRAEDYLDITPEMLELASPDNLRPYLIRPSSAGITNVSGGDRGLVYYQSLNPDTRRTEPLYIAVTPSEFLLMVGSIATLGQRAVKRVVTLRTPEGSQPSSVDEAAAKRGGVHVVEGLLEKLQTYRTNDLEQRIATIHKFQEALKYPGLARFGSEGQMRIALAYLQTYVMGDMLTVLGEQRRWSPGQASRAQRAIEKNIILEREGNHHLRNFGDYLKLWDEWNGHKLAITLGREYTAKQMIKRLQAEADSRPR